MSGIGNGDMDGLDDDDISLLFNQEQQPAPPALPKNAPRKLKASDVVGLKKPNKRNRRQCRGCILWFADDETCLGASMCHACKNKVDNIGRIARSQGKLAWYQEVRSNDIKLQQVLIEYNSRVSHAVKRVPRAAVLQYLEVVIASTAVITEEIGIMMYWRQYVAFAESIEGGKLSDAQAKIQWSTWEQQIDEPGSTWPPSDKKGPNGEKRIWVKTQDIMKFQSKMERQKQMALKDKDVKNSTDADLAKMHKKIQLDHDFVAGREVGDLRDAASHIMKSGGAEAFSHRGIDLPDIEQLGHGGEVPEPEDDDDTAGGGDGDESAADGRSEASSGLANPKAKRGRWFDYDKLVGRAERAHATAQNSFKAGLLWSVSKATEVITLVNQSNPDVQTKVSNELRTLEGRLEGLKLVINGSELELQNYINKYSEDGRGSPALASVGVGSSDGNAQASLAKSQAGRSAIGHAPPCASYKDLQIIAQIDVIAHEFREAGSTEDIKAVTAKIGNTRRPMKELAARVDEATKELTKTRDDVMKSSTGGKARGKGRGKAGKGGGPDPRVCGPPSTVEVLMQVVPDCGKSLSSVTPSTVDGLVVDYKSLEEPCIINIAALAKKFTDEAPIKSLIDNLITEYDKSESKTKHGRGGMACPAENAATVQVRDCLVDALPGSTRDSTCQKLVTCMSLGLWAVSKDQCKSFVEPESLASLRFQSVGSRELVLVAFGDLVNYMNLKKGVEKKNITPVRAAAFLRGLDKASIEAFAKDYAIFHGTVSAGHMLYTPACFVGVERTGTNADSAGFVLRGFYKDPKAKTRFEELLSIFELAQVKPEPLAVVKACVESATTMAGAV